jgi:hypothetical protein
MKQGHGGRLVFFATIAAIGLWLLTLVVTPLFLEFVVSRSEACAANEADCPGYMASLGLVGDMFGSVNALFSGLALGAIALTLWIESKSRREAKKPLVIGMLKSAGIAIARPEALADGNPKISVAIPLDVRNQSEDAGINVAVTAKFVLEHGQVTSETLDWPIVKGGDEALLLSIELTGRALADFLVKLTAREKVSLHVETKYQSLEGVAWRTSVTYECFCRESSKDIARLNSVRDPAAWRSPESWEESAVVGLEHRVKKGSWAHTLQ